MWLNLSIFIAALAGLVALFVLKAFEQRGGSAYVLAPLRRTCDSFVHGTWHTLREGIRQKGRRSFEVGYRTVLHASHEAYVHGLAVFHFFVMRLHVYLSRRRAQVAKSREKVSSHLKDMLEYKRETEAHNPQRR